MSKTYRPYNPNQMFLLPPSLKDWLPEGHLAYFVSDLVDQLDLSAIEQVYEREERGYPPYHPRMMVKVLLYAECVGVRSSRKIEKRLVEDVAFRVLGAGNTPSFRTIAEFRSRHLKELAGLFAQVLTVCWKSGLVSLKHVALDGTKIRANASKHKAMSYGRMKETRARLEKEIEERFRSNERLDEEEDRKFGFDKRGDELPEDLVIREKRLAKIKEAMAALEEEARAEEEAAKSVDAGQPAETATTPSRKKRGPKPKDPPGTPKDKAQRNFTDPDSRIMKNSDKAFIQAYNAQAIVDGESQVIIAADLTNKASDVTHLPDMVKQVESNLNRKPRELSADAGYFSEKNVTFLEKRKIAAYIPPDKQKHSASVEPPPRGRIPASLSCKDRMRRKLRTVRGRKTYALRKQIVEPVFGQVKTVQGVRQFLLRSKLKVRAEWLIVCTAHNILKLFRSGKPANTAVLCPT
jgi:transposase